MSNWIIRVHDPSDRDEATVDADIRNALTLAGFEVFNINPPLQLNPEPLRIRESPQKP